MIRHRTPSHESEDSQSLMLDLTTLLDIMFILLVFFILTAGVSYRALDLTLPAAASEETEPAKASHHIMLEIKTDGYALDGKTFENFETLKTEIAPLLQKEADKELVIAGDRNVSLERLLELLTFLESRGIDAANILMQRKE